MRAQLTTVAIWRFLPALRATCLATPFDYNSKNPWRVQTSKNTGGYGGVHVLFMFILERAGVGMIMMC